MEAVLADRLTQGFQKGFNKKSLHELSYAYLNKQSIKILLL